MSYTHLRTAALAATLLAGTGALALAQSGMHSGSQQPSASSPSATQSPSGSQGMSGSERSGSPTTGQGAGSEQSPSGAAQPQSRQGQTTGQTPSGQAPSGAETRTPGAQPSNRNAQQGTTPSGRNAQQGTTPSGRNAQQGTTPSGRTAQEPTQNRNAQGSRQQNRMTGAAPSNERVNLTTEQKTTIRNQVINAKGAPRVSHVNFDVRVGTVVPTTVHFAPVPETLVEIHPAWRGYEYFVYNDEVVIIQPHTRKIVEVIVLS